MEFSESVVSTVLLTGVPLIERGDDGLRNSWQCSYWKISVKFQFTLFL